MIMHLYHRQTFFILASDGNLNSLRKLFIIKSHSSTILNYIIAYSDVTYGHVSRVQGRAERGL